MQKPDLIATRARRCAGAAALVLVLTTGQAPARGWAEPSAGPPGDSLTIAPSIIDTTARPGAFVAPITVTNRTRVVFRVRFYPALVHQRLDGSLVIRETRRERAAARRRFALAPSGFLIRPGESKVLRERFIRPGAGRPAADLAAVVEAVPMVPPKKAPGFRIRLLAALLVNTPRSPAPRGRIAGIFVTQNGRRLFRFAARIRNTGRVHGYPTALRIRLRDSAGNVLFSAAPRPSFVLPGYQRDFQASLFRRLPLGRYRVESTGRFGAAALRRVAYFVVRKRS